MNHGQLKKFAQGTRVKLKNQIENRLEYVTSHDDEYLRAHDSERKIIADKIREHGRDYLVEETAYIWFNRFTAIRFMDNRGYNSVKILSPAEGESQPQVMASIKQGKIPRPMLEHSLVINSYLDGTIRVQDPDREIYKTALLAWCNYLGSLMPWMFDKVNDWAALLLPLDILSAESVIADFRNTITPEDCGNVEIIGWLYQYYISEKKDEVFEGLKKNTKITPENIPAATQLFTPHWIVRYMTDNSLGRLYLESFPQSRIRDKLEYYIENKVPEERIIIKDPAEIKLLDPCCGSGHILVYAFDLLYMMYEEAGYSVSEIPSLIIKNNLYGIDIDKRASSLASFALAMKGMGKDRFFLERNIVPNIISPAVINADPDSSGIKMSITLKKSFALLSEVDNFGSLIPVTSSCYKETENHLKELSERKNRDWIEDEVFEGLETLLYLSPRYHCVITNPPYMGGKGMNARLSEWLKINYPDVKSDLFSAFVVRNTQLALPHGHLGFMTPFVWMFISSYEKLRLFLIEEKTITSLIQLEYSGFDGATVPICTFTIANAYYPNYKGGYVRLSDFKGAAVQGPKALEIIQAAMKDSK